MSRTGHDSIRDEDVLSAALYPKVFKDYMLFRDEFGPVDGLPTRLFFTGPEIGEEFEVEIEAGKILKIKVVAISELHQTGTREVFCEMNGQLRSVIIDDKSVSEVCNMITGLCCFSKWFSLMSLSLATMFCYYL